MNVNESPTAATLLDDALGTLVEGCDALGIPPEEWYSPMVGTFEPDSAEGWVGRVAASDEHPPEDPPLFYYDLKIRAASLGGRDAIDAACEQYRLVRLAGGWEPFSDFTSGRGERHARTVYFTKDGARTGIELNQNGCFQTYDSPASTDPTIAHSPGQASEPESGSAPIWNP